MTVSEAFADPSLGGGSCEKRTPMFGTLGPRELPCYLHESHAYQLPAGL